MTKLRLRVAPWLFILCAACSQPAKDSGAYKIAYVPNKYGQSGIFVMNADTTGSKLLTSDAMAQLRFASWSPNGRKIAFFTSRSQDREILKTYRMPYELLLYTMDPSGANQKRLLNFPVLDFAWSPDGKQMFFISAHEGKDRDSPEVLSAAKNPLSSVYVLDMQTGAQTRLPGAGRSCSASWSPDGTRLVVSYGEADNGSLYIVSADGKQGGRLTDGSTIDCRPMWSPDGKSIAYVAVPKLGGDVSGAGVWTIAPDGSNKKRVMDEVIYFATWSLDSRRLLVQSASGVRLIDPDGGNPVLLSAGLRRAVNAIFTPDGKAVMFCSDDSGGWNIYLSSLDGKTRKTITGQTNSSNFCFSPLLGGH